MNTILLSACLTILIIPVLVTGQLKADPNQRALLHLPLTGRWDTSQSSTTAGSGQKSEDTSSTDKFTTSHNWMVVKFNMGTELQLHYLVSI